MHRTLGVIALVLCTALVGCTVASDIDYRAGFPDEATRTVGLSEATITPVAFKAAPKGDTPIASEAGATSGSSGGTSGSTGGLSGLRASAWATPSSPSSSGSVTITLKVLSIDGKPVGGAKATLTLKYSSMAGAGTQKKTITITTNSSGTGSKTLAATPFNGPTMVSIWGTATGGGTSGGVRGSGYSTK
ncbi:MAG: hypothetical protein ACYC77_03600 [Coriobacteriia bacterium]